MSFIKHINDVSKDFFLSTNVPIQTFGPTGETVHSLGSNEVFDWVFNHQNIYERLIHKIHNNSHNKVVTVSCLENIHFTACPVCPRNNNKGIFILGPYSSYINNNIKAVYKPNSLMTHLLSFLSSLCQDCPSKSHPTLDTAPYSLHVKKAIDYIDARYTEPISLTSISEYLAISKAYFCQLFKEETDQTFTGFLNHLRIEKSKALLLEGNLSVLDIALSVGYNNQNYYNIMFKKITDQTPLEFRNSA